MVKVKMVKLILLKALKKHVMGAAVYIHTFSPSELDGGRYLALGCVRFTARGGGGHGVNNQ